MIERLLHIRTKDNAPLCNPYLELDLFLPDSWAVTCHLDKTVCGTCRRIYRIMARTRKTAWCRERLDRLPDKTVEAMLAKWSNE